VSPMARFASYALEMNLTRNSSRATTQDKQRLPLTYKDCNHYVIAWENCFFEELRSSVTGMIHALDNSRGYSKLDIIEVKNFRTSEAQSSSILCSYPMSNRFPIESER